MITLRRSMLFLPGNNERFLARALESEADSIVLDLEDAVTPEQKPEAREMVKHFLRAADFRGKERVVRVNGVTTPWGEEDLKAVVEGGVDLVLVPKADGEAIVQTSDRIVTEAEERLGVTGGRTKLMPLIETALGVISVERTAFSSPRIVALAFGGGDYGLSTRARVGPDQLEYLYPMTRIMLAARAAGEIPIGTPYAQDIRDLDAVAQSARREHALGYEGKLVIHPSHIKPVNEVFTPTQEEIVYARRVIEAFEAADRGAITVDGRLIEHLHVTEARRLLEVARKAGALRD